MIPAEELAAWQAAEAAAEAEAAAMRGRVADAADALCAAYRATAEARAAYVRAIADGLQADPGGAEVERTAAAVADAERADARAYLRFRDAVNDYAARFGV